MKPKYDWSAIKLRYMCSQYKSVTEFCRNEGIDISKAGSGAVVGRGDEKEKLLQSIYKDAIKKIKEDKATEISNRIEQIDRGRKLNLKGMLDDIGKSTDHKDKDGNQITAKKDLIYKARVSYNNALRLEVGLPNVISENKNDNTTKIEGIDIQILGYKKSSNISENDNIDENNDNNSGNDTENDV